MSDFVTAFITPDRLARLEAVAEAAQAYRQAHRMFLSGVMCGADPENELIKEMEAKQAACRALFAAVDAMNRTAHEL